MYWYEENKIAFLYLHVVSRTYHGRQREPSLNALRYPICALFMRHCILSGGTQRRALSYIHSEEMKI